MLQENKLIDIPTFEFSSYGVNQIRGKSSKNKEKIANILLKRPQPNHVIDHHPVSIESLLTRAGFIGSNENLHDKNVAFVGDFDSTNIAMNVLYKLKNSTIFDIDKNLLNFFKEVSEANKYNSDIVYQDIFEFNSQRIKDLSCKYDIFVTDPPYTVKGMIKFIEFAIHILKEGGRGYIAIPYHQNIDWTERVLLEAQKTILQNNCSIIEIMKSFHEYPTTDGMKSSMVVIRKGSDKKKAKLDTWYTYNTEPSKPVLKK